MAELKHEIHFGIQAAWGNQAWKLANIRSAVGTVITLALPCIAFMPQNRQDKEKRGSSKTFTFFLLIVLLLSAPGSARSRLGG